MSTRRYSYLQATDSDGRMVFPRVETERVFLVNVHEGEVEIPEEKSLLDAELVWVEHNSPDRPLGQTIRSMVIGDVVAFHEDDGRFEVWVAADVGFVRASKELAASVSSIARRGTPAHGTVEGDVFFPVFRTETAEVA